MIHIAKIITNIFRVKDNQMSFDTLVPFKNSTVYVYINNTKLDSNNYLEINNSQVLINNLVENDSIVAIKYESLSNLPVISHSTSSISLFKTFSSESKLQINQKYSVTFKIKDLDINSSFASKCSPYFSSIKKIREDIGALGDSVTDDTINHFIYENSKELVEKLRQNFTGVVQYVGSEIIINYPIINLSISDSGSFLPNNAVAPFIKQWVRYKTDLDIVNSIYLGLSGNESRETKKIGPLTIEKAYKIPQIRQILQQFKENFMTFDSVLNGDSGTSASFTKAGSSNPYPLTGRRSF